MYMYISIGYCKYLCSSVLMYNNIMYFLSCIHYAYILSLSLPPTSILPHSSLSLSHSFSFSHPPSSLLPSSLPRPLSLSPFLPLPSPSPPPLPFSLLPQFLGLPVAVIQQLYVSVEVNCSSLPELCLRSHYTTSKLAAAHLITRLEQVNK